MPNPIDDHYDTVTKAMMDGRVVPFLGAGANRCDRQKGDGWERGKQLPDGSELSKYLAEQFGYHQRDRNNLARVAQYVDVMRGSGDLYERLHKLLDVDYPLTSLARFLAALEAVLHTKAPPCHQLIVTTNYDDQIERAFQQAGESFDLVTYVAEGDQRGRFAHRAPDGSEYLIEKANEYRGNLKERATILKIHGTVDRGRKRDTPVEEDADEEDNKDSYVITEDHYIEYLTRTDISSLLPGALAARMRKNHFLFLGYSMRDWNLRVILHRIWGERKRSYQSWAIQRYPDPIEQKFWSKHGVDILNVGLADYVAELSRRLGLPITAAH